MIGGGHKGDGERIVARDLDTRNAAQMASASFRLAALDSEFLLGDAMRGVRLQLEFMKADAVLTALGIRSTIVVFGSSRVFENGPGEHARWYRETRAFGRIASEQGGALRCQNGLRDNVIATGGGPGLMEAANRGAADVDAPSIGFNITLPTEQQPNPYSTPALTFRFTYFAIRKMHLALRARALVVAPGGFGTLDELFEILNLRITGKAPATPVVLLDEAYWRSVVDFDALVAHGTIAPEHRQGFSFAGDAEDAWRQLSEAGILAPPAAPPPPEILLCDDADRY